MKDIVKAGLIGCGDYLRWEIDKLNNSKQFKVKSTFDLDRGKSESMAKKIHARPAEDADSIFADPEISIVMIYTPPWARKELFEKAVKAGKHIITTKPLAPDYRDAKELSDIVDDRVACAVFYGRTGDAGTEKIREILVAGEIGSLALYKEDWFHHYPTWNDWATDPKKNGGPFLDAMVHNLNKSRYLVGVPASSLTYFSENYAQNLKCNDTEFMKLDFENGAASYLFITWAADLEVYDPEGNDREHYGILHMITDKGWYVTEEQSEKGHWIRAKKEDRVREWPVNPPEQTPYDEVVRSIRGKEPQKYDISWALEDLRIFQKARNNVEKGVKV